MTASNGPDLVLPEDKLDNVTLNCACPGICQDMVAVSVTEIAENGMPICLNEQCDRFDYDMSIYSITINDFLLTGDIR